MILVTSLSPSHSNKDNQIISINSWMNAGLECFSLNPEKEIDTLKKEYKNGVSIIKTSRTVGALIGKQLVSINAILDFANEMNDDLLIINSDIIIDQLPVLRQDGITVFSRYDYENNLSQSDMFIYGFDAFFIPKKFLSIYPPSIYSLGACFWDHWIPYRAILNSIPLYYPFGKFCYHKKHDAQYSTEEWFYLGNFFKCEFRLNEQLTIPQIATQNMAIIKQKLIQ